MEPLFELFDFLLEIFDLGGFLGELLLRGVQIGYSSVQLIPCFGQLGDLLIAHGLLFENIVH